MNMYSLIVSGGTFDHLHRGHKDFLTFQFSQSKNVLIGLTTDEFARSTRGDSEIQSFTKRKDELRAFLIKQNFLHRADIVPIHSVAIPDKFQNHPIEAIAVTESTYNGAEVVNKDRVAKGKEPLPIITFAMTLAEDGKPISSTRVREGVISREGKRYIRDEWLSKERSITDVLRKELKKPFGTLIVNNSFPYEELVMSRVVTVGDIAAKTLLDRSMYPKIAVVDFIVERKKQYADIKDHGFSGKEVIHSVANKPGRLSPDLFKACVAAMREKDRHTIIVVDGEEDLAVLPVILAAPLGYTICYGQPGEGLVLVTVTEEMKQMAYELVNRFRIHN